MFLPKCCLCMRDAGASVEFFFLECGHFVCEACISVTPPTQMHMAHGNTSSLSGFCSSCNRQSQAISLADSKGIPRNIYEYVSSNYRNLFNEAFSKLDSVLKFQHQHYEQVIGQLRTENLRLKESLEHFNTASTASMLRQQHSQRTPPKFPFSNMIEPPLSTTPSHSPYHYSSHLQHAQDVLSTPRLSSSNMSSFMSPHRTGIGTPMPHTNSIRLPTPSPKVPGVSPIRPSTALNDSFNQMTVHHHPQQDNQELSEIMAETAPSMNTPRKQPSNDETSNDSSMTQISTISRTKSLVPKALSRPPPQHQSTPLIQSVKQTTIPAQPGSKGRSTVRADTPLLISNRSSPHQQEKKGLLLRKHLVGQADQLIEQNVRPQTRSTTNDENMDPSLSSTTSDQNVIDKQASVLGLPKRVSTGHKDVSPSSKTKSPPTSIQKQNKTSALAPHNTPVNPRQLLSLATPSRQRPQSSRGLANNTRQ
ncbi:hypothetical protein C9374_000263 [Naegleria lovaniensis]|uniref:RING-type domain-containing protein n=1 Tax=Naegleria lovaniensis TaxID=51637 RepID=A0AA88KP81_NAELO|nr:uncharacterized protein C9374_000263 [Naegleria lovaniensis]KAG2388824.1 hypothetical protein C9374_000263 [Naegleria lovaniensis]